MEFHIQWWVWIFRKERKMLVAEIDLSTKVNTKDEDRCIVVDSYGKDVWMSVWLSGGGASVSMTIEQAKQLMAGLQQVVQELENHGSN